MADWAQAGLIGGIGFLTVFGVLTILMIVLFVFGAIVRRSSKNRQTESGKQS